MNLKKYIDYLISYFIFIKKYLIILLSLFYFFSNAQEPAYLHYSIEDGLPSTLVYCMLQDKNGFMWFGTNNGLARFDGQRFKTYGVEDGLPDPEVLNIFEDGTGRLWLSCFQKKPCYLKDGKIFTNKNDTLLNDLTLTNGHYHFYKESDHALWITSSENSCKIDNNTIQCFKHYDANKNKYYQFHEFKNERISYFMKEIYKKNKKNIIKIYPQNILIRPRALIKDNIYVYHGNTIIKIQEKNNYINYVENTINIPNTLSDISLVIDDYIWIGNLRMANGIYKINFESEEILNYLYGKQINKAYKDKEDTMWFGTSNEGVFAMPDEATSIFNKPNTSAFQSENITAINSIKKNQLLIGDALGNIYSYKNKTWEKKQFTGKIKQSKIRQISVVNENDWTAIMDNNIYGERNGLPKKVNVFNHKNKRSLFNSAPKCIKNHKGNTFVGNILGLVQWEDLGRPAQILYYGTRVTAVEVDTEENIWIGGINGLLSQKDSFKIEWGNQFKPIGGRILDIQQATAGRLWVVTADNGLLDVFINNGKVTGVKAMNELLSNPVNNIKNIYLGNDQTVWMPTNSGIYGLDSLLNIQHINTTDGLPSNDVNALTIDGDTLWAATTAGLAMVPLNRKKSNANFKSYISGIQYEIEKKTIDLDLVYHQQNVTIPANSSGIDIQLTGLHFNSAENTTFEYIEEECPLPLQWVTWGNLVRSTVNSLGGRTDTLLIKDGHYYMGSNVPRGSFKAMCTAITKDGTKSIYPDKKTFVILPNWYETIWFTIAIAGLLGYMGWLFYRQYTKAKRYQRVASEQQLQAIKAQVNPHFIGNSINAIQQFFYPPDPVRASEYIATFTSLLRQTMHLSEVPFIPFDEELSFITDYLNMVQLRFGDRFEYTISGNDEIPSDLQFPAMLLQPILENATIHGFAQDGISKLELNFILKDQKLVTAIKDNGIGIEVSKAIKNKKDKKRISKGIQMLRTKINVLNKMHRSDIALSFLDLSTSGKEEHGTLVTLSFSAEKIKPA